MIVKNHSAWFYPLARPRSRFFFTVRGMRGHNITAWALRGELTSARSPRRPVLPIWADLFNTEISPVRHVVLGMQGSYLRRMMCFCLIPFAT
jgi:hypothetical protein